METPQSEIFTLRPFVRQPTPVLAPVPAALVERIAACKRQAVTSARAAIFSSSLDQLAHAIDAMFVCASVCRSTEALLREPANHSTAFLVQRVEACRKACHDAYAACGSVTGIEAACRACRQACAEAIEACDAILALLKAGATPGPAQTMAVAAG